MPLRLLAMVLLILGLLIQPLEVGAVQVSPTCPAGMEWIAGGTFRMGSDDHYPDELSADAVTVEGFCIDRHEITNAEFDAFVKATGYVTVAERPIPKDQYPDLAEDQIFSWGTTYSAKQANTWQWREQVDQIPNKTASAAKTGPGGRYTAAAALQASGASQISFDGLRPPSSRG
uniref:formylglycine-generating enzyme family protein n=1 Tax=Synechococcus sp. CS-1329 TaxID=2847975 RepID=UPI00223C456E|nr:formylglycine-generating enzyme family protein [Synechococcus sp. CS-1329]